ncbi:hypothetical protein JEQ12_003805 [Ovis aries]|uniref:Cilia- and flagella-associated protein 74 n=1 Tax=Ovis aries TaxID=9940 RepID=A0A835ZUZ1_SHEEP|nr:hypothetical protein JEQ12_003805 [Ovis aries]
MPADRRARQDLRPEKSWRYAMVLPLCPDTKTTVRDPVSMPADRNKQEARMITWQLLGWMMHAERSGYRLRVSASVPPSCSVQGGVLFSPYGAEQGITHLALEDGIHSFGEAETTWQRGPHAKSLQQPEINVYSNKGCSRKLGFMAAFSHRGPEDQMEEDDKKLLDDKPLMEDGIEQSKDKQKQRLTAQEKMQASLLRRDLSQVDQLHEEKDLFIQKTRGELRACRRRMELLVKQQESVAAEMAAERAANNMAAMGRLEAASQRLCSELKNEWDLQARMMAVLQQSESALWQIEVQEGQLEDARKSAQEEAAAARRGLQERAAKQLDREMGASEKAEQNRLLRARRCVHLQKELGLRQQKLVEEAQKNHRKALKFLKASLGRIREQEQKEELETREHMRRRMDAVLALKNSISANRETLRKFQAWGQTKRELAEQQAQAEKKAILAQGGDAFKHLCHQRRRQELEAQNRAFEEEQKRRKQEIVSRLLKEEAVEDRRRPRPEPPRPAGQRSLRDQTWSYVATVCDGQNAEAPPCCPLENKSRFYQSSLLLTAISSESVQGDGSSLSGEDTLAWPEIPGLWKEDYKPFQVSKEDVDRKPVGGTKMDKDILARTMQRLRSGVIHKQVASGREFRGCPFNSKPKFIHFKDFDVGKVYKKKITLINATYTINYCKLVGVDEGLQDFIHVE